MTPIFRGDNHSEKFFYTILYLILSIVTFSSLFVGETSLLAKIVLGLLGLATLILPLYSFLLLRYQITCEDDHIKITYNPLKKKVLQFSYSDLESITFTNPIKGTDHIVFLFKKKQRLKRKFIIQLTDSESIIPLIRHCKKKNSNINFEASALSGDLYDFIKKEASKQP